MFTAEFKLRVALYLLSGGQTLSELASKHKVYQAQISQWKQQVKEQIVAGFASKAQKAQQGVKPLHAKIGKPTVEKAFSQHAFPKI